MAAARRFQLRMATLRALQVISCYFSVVYLAFFDADEAELPYREHLDNVGLQAGTLLCTRSFSFLVGSVALPHFKAKASQQQSAVAFARRQEKLKHANGESEPSSESLNVAAAEAAVAMSMVREGAHLQPVDYQCGLDDDIAQFAIQFGFVVGFFPCFSLLACIAFALNLVMLQGVIFKKVWVQQRDRPLSAPGLGVWKRMIGGLTLCAMVSNAVLMSRLLAETEARMAESAEVEPSCKESAQTELALPTLLLFCLVLLRSAVGSLLPDTPHWLALLHRRRAHFEKQPAFLPAKLASAVQQGGRRSLAGLLREAAYGCACAAPLQLWRRRGERPPVPEWHATGRTEEDERAEAALDAEALARAAELQTSGAQGLLNKLFQKVTLAIGTLGLLSTELL